MKIKFNTHTNKRQFGNINELNRRINWTTIFHKKCEKCKTLFFFIAFFNTKMPFAVLFFTFFFLFSFVFHTVNCSPHTPSIAFYYDYLLVIIFSPQTIIINYFPLSDFTNTYLLITIINLPIFPLIVASLSIDIFLISPLIHYTVNLCVQIETLIME